MLQDFGTAHRVLDRNEARDCAKLTEVVKGFMTNKAKALVKAAGGQPVLYTYGSDGTPLMTQMRVTAPKLTGNGRVVRRAGKAVEYLVQRAFLKSTTPSGDPLRTVLCVDPLPLAQGKTAWHEFTACQRFFPILRTLGHTGIIISHAVFDRAMHSAISRKLMQRQSLFYEVQGGAAPRYGGVAVQ